MPINKLSIVLYIIFLILLTAIIIKVETEADRAYLNGKKFGYVEGFQAGVNYEHGRY